MLTARNHSRYTEFVITAISEGKQSMSKSPRIHPHEVFADKTGLAKMYLEDGAFYTAADILRRLADAIDAHVDDVNKEFGIPTKAEMLAMKEAGQCL